MKLKIPDLHGIWKRMPSPVRAAASLAVTFLFIVGAFTLGYLLGGAGKESKPSGGDHAAHTAESAATVWTCSMHPSVRQPKPGKCPICFMDLIPATTGGDDGPSRQVTLTHAAVALAQLHTAKVERRFVDVEVRMVGKVDYDETRVTTITAWVGGRIDRLYVDYTGVPVKKGEHLVYLYSPELYAAQDELIQALKLLDEAKGTDLPDIRRSAADTVAAAREKIRLLGLKPEQIAEVERTRKLTDHIVIYAPIGGIVVHKNAVEGMYVQTGSKIYTLADLSRVWVVLDAYESDLPWVHYAQQVEFTTEAHPGVAFTGTVTFIEPVLDGRTRTVKVRLNVDNKQGRLKPGMFVRAVVKARVTDRGRALEPKLAGKWICTMHPEVLKDKAGQCDLCGMDLVPTESLGFAAKPNGIKPPLVIPASAPLITGRRALVYVQVPGTEKPTFEGRDVVLGPRAGDYYVVLDGLAEGELVVSHGAFVLDSELQLRGKPSMMGAPVEPDGKQPAPAPVTAFAEVPAAFRQQLTAVLDAYLAAWRALAGDDPKAAAAAGRQLADALAAIDMTLLKGDAHMAWMKDLDALTKGATRLAAGADIQKQREAFDLLSKALPVALERFGHASKKPIGEFHCPMAFDNRGADWLQDSDDLLNPYFGAAMLKCGEMVRRVEGRGSSVEGSEKRERPDREE